MNGSASTHGAVVQSVHFPCSFYVIVQCGNQGFAQNINPIITCRLTCIHILETETGLTGLTACGGWCGNHRTCGLVSNGNTTNWFEGL